MIGNASVFRVFRNGGNGIAGSPEVTDQTASRSTAFHFMAR